MNRMQNQTSSSDRWVVVHAGHRDWYQMPIALAETNRLAKFVTDWYTPLDVPLWRSMALLRKEFPLGLGRRFSSALSSTLVQDAKARFLASYVYRKFSGRPFRDEIQGERLGRMAAREAKAHKANLLAASYHGSTAFSNAPSSTKKVLFQVHPHPRFLRNLYRSTLHTHPTYAGLSREPEMTVSKSDLAAWELESSLADVIICASKFTARSLIECGISPERIRVVPYGIDAGQFRPGHQDGSRPFTLLFVGQKVARKSLGLLLTAWRNIRTKDSRMVVAGGHGRDASILDPFLDMVEEMPPTSLQGVVKLYQDADVFALPSVAEGFGHVYLEALACGTPVICTENTGAADLIEHGKSGWIVPAGDLDALQSLLSWCINNRDKVRSMRIAARQVAEKYSWDQFRSNLRNTLACIS